MQSKPSRIMSSGWYAAGCRDIAGGSAAGPVAGNGAAGGPESCRAEGRLGSADASRKGQGHLTSVRLWKLSFASGGGGRRRERKCEGGTYRLCGGLWIAGQSEDDRRTNTERNDLRTHGCAARRDNDQGRPSRTRQL